MLGMLLGVEDGMLLGRTLGLADGDEQDGNTKFIAKVFVFLSNNNVSTSRSDTPESCRLANDPVHLELFFPKIALFPAELSYLL